MNARTTFSTSESSDVELASGARETIRTLPCPVCYLCGSRGSVFYTELPVRTFGVPGEWNLRQCSNADCSLVWMDPQPHREDITNLYSSYYTHNVEPESQSRLGRMKMAILCATLGYEHPTGGPIDKVGGWLLARISLLREMGEGMILWCPSKWRGRLLDVGCGNGALLKNFAQLGWDVHGIEADPTAATLARNGLGLDVQTGSIESGGFADEYFDVITMSHVIEHLPDPTATLAKCYRTLRPGGHLVVVTPNSESWARRLFGRNWSAWELPRHFFLFSTGTLKSCAEKAGFRISVVRSTARDARVAWMASLAIRHRGQLPGFRLRLTPGAMLGGVLFQAAEHLRGGRAGEELVMIATRE
jgi:2-polyprenyl-3-methyl-5-hydroxy-6-metoxy-1,4-benzoquinol methylase